MTTEAPAPRAGASAGDRLIGAIRGERPGPLLLCISSLHGNEPAGIHALERILSDLSDDEIRGDLVALRGNLRALGAGRRFIDEDLNRVWQKDRVRTVLASLRAGPDGQDADQGALPMVGSAELAEQRDLLAAVRDEVRAARGPVYVLDLHTTSSESVPFTTLGDTLQNRALALVLPIPVVLGLEEQIDGAMLQYFDRLGWRSIGIEGGAHDDASSVDAHEDAVWLILDDLGLISAERKDDIRRRRERLGLTTRGLPRVVDVRYRHEISPSDEFTMKPGYRNFAAIRAREPLAADRRGPVLSPLRGRVLMPLYQKQGDDGFFIVRRVHPAWLAVSRVLRRAGADRFATWIPGVQHHPSRTDAVILAPWARNRAVIGVLHLMGFNARREGSSLLMIRRIEAENPDPSLDPTL